LRLRNRRIARDCCKSWDAHCFGPESGAQGRWFKCTRENKNLVTMEIDARTAAFNTGIIARQMFMPRDSLIHRLQRLPGESPQGRRARIATPNIFMDDGVNVSPPNGIALLTHPLALSQLRCHGSYAPEYVGRTELPRMVIFARNRKLHGLIS